MKTLYFFFFLLFGSGKAQIRFNGPATHGNDEYGQKKYYASQGCRTGVCQEVVRCAGRLTEAQRKASVCRLPSNAIGLCCTILTNNDVRQFTVQSTESVENFQSCPANIDVSSRAVSLSAASPVRFPITNLTRVVQLTPKSAEFLHDSHQAPRGPAISIGSIAESSLPSARSKQLFQFEESFCETNVVDTDFIRTCPRPPKCNPFRKFRDTNGTCNNLRKPLLGSSFTPVQRILRNAYFDGFNMPRKGAGGRPLPSARLVSLNLVSTDMNPSGRFTNLLMAAGQFLDHDLVQVPVHRSSEDENINCCLSEFGNNSLECFPIEIPPGDPEFGGRTCINFVRSLPAPAIDCRLGPSEQQNQLTHWMDSSNIYGSFTADALNLRSFTGGRLRLSSPFGSNSKPLLPNDFTNEECINPNQCFLAGDTRVNEQPTLAVVHTLWARHHNNVANSLAKINPSFNDERLYLEARRIVNAQWQHVMFNEWLPIILGVRLMETFGLWALGKGFSNDYRDDIDASVTNAFGAAGFRFGHTLIPTFLNGHSVVDSKFTRRWRLRDVFNDASILLQEGVSDEIALGFTLQPVEKFDRLFTDEIINHLFERNGEGLDLIALNLQRGRDHGIPGYVRYREVCGSGPTRSFDDLRSNISPDQIERFKRVYRSVEDIDLFAGMFSENRFGDAFVGRTFLCLIGDQFARLKKGDRFFYDLAGQAGSFTPDQLDSIRKFSWARLICDTSDRIKQIQPLVFEMPDNIYNIFTDCDSDAIPKTDYSVFKF